VLDHFFDFQAIIKDVLKRPFVTAGFTAFVLLVPLAVTSTAAMIRRLGKRRRRDEPGGAKAQSEQGHLRGQDPARAGGQGNQMTARSRQSQTRSKQMIKEIVTCILPTVFLATVFSLEAQQQARY
jgi:hypothetical protein